MLKSFKLEVITPEEIVFSEEILSATFLGEKGIFMVLKNHENGVFAIRPGIIDIQIADEQSKTIIAGAGVVQILPECTKVLIDKSAENLNYTVKELKQKLSDTKGELEEAQTETQKFNLKNEIMFLEAMIESKSH